MKTLAGKKWISREYNEQQPATSNGDALINRNANITLNSEQQIT